MSCVDPDHASLEVHLNASTPFQSDNISVTTSLILNSVVFKALVDSSSPHCFVDPQFISMHQLITYSVSPIQLQLFDGTSNHTTPQASYRFSLGLSLHLHFI